MRFFSFVVFVPLQIAFIPLAIVDIVLRLAGPGRRPGPTQAVRSAEPGTVRLAEPGTISLGEPTANLWGGLSHAAQRPG